jgi:hypothetical protein
VFPGLTTAAEHEAKPVNTHGSALLAPDDLHCALALGFATVCGRLSEARARRRKKDSTNNRTAAADCLAQVDAILDMYLDAERASCTTTAYAGT